MVWSDRVARITCSCHAGEIWKESQAGAKSFLLGKGYTSIGISVFYMLAVLK